IPSIRFTKLIIYHLQRKHKFHPRPDSPLHLPNEEPVLGYLKFSAKGTKREAFGMPIPGNLITTDIQDTMADVNVNAPADQAPTMAPPTRTDDQIMSHIKWVPIGKTNCYLDVEKLQSNPIYKIAVDILKHTNFFRAFTASSTIPSIYIQLFWDTVGYDKTVGCYKCQLDEQWFDLTKNTLRDALQITLVNNNQAFTSPLSSDALINFVNELGYPKLVRNLSNVRKHKFHPRPDSPLHLPNEEPVLGYLKFSAKGTKREAFGMPIPGNLITTDIQGESYYQEYLAKVAKHQRYMAGETGSDPDSPAPKPAKTAKKSKQTAPKADPRPPVSKPASSQQPEPKGQDSRKEAQADECVAEDILEKEPRVDDEEADVQRALEESLKSLYDVPRGLLPPVVIREPEFGKYQPLLEVPGKGKEKLTEEQVAHGLLTLQTPKKKSPVDRYIFQRRTSIPTGSFGHDESSSLYAELGLMDSEEESDEDVPGTDVGVQGQAGPNPGDAEASQPLPSPVVHAGSDLEHIDLDVADVSTQPYLEQMDEGFTATAYPKLEQRLDSHGARLYTLEHLDIPHQVSKAVHKVVADAVDWAIQAPLQNRFRDLPKADLKEILHQRIWETNSYKTHEDHMQLYEALEKSMNRDHSEELLKDLAEARKKKKKRRPFGASESPGASGFLQVPPPPPPPPSTNQEDLQMDDDMAPDAQAQSSDDEDIRNAHISKNNWASALVSTYSPPPEDSLLAQTGDIAMFMNWHNVSKPLPLGGPPGHVTIQSDFFFNKDLKYLIYGSKGSRPALSISKIKAAYYLDVGLKQMVPNLMWIEEECKYDIYAKYGISHWWFQRQRFYIDRHTSEGDRRVVRTHMRILSVVRIEVFSMYGYDYMKKIVLHRADLNEYVIAERDFKYLYPSDFKDLYLLNLQEDFQLEVESYKTQLNLTKPRWDATGFEYKHDYTIIDSSRSVTFQDRYGVQMIMRFNEIHKFSDGTLQQIDEALDYRVKEFKINRINPGLNTRFWTMKDVDRSKEFMFTIQK
nr:E-beta-farnesene synthase [Tanacetum cinerariifolium]